MRRLFRTPAPVCLTAALLVAAPQQRFYAPTRPLAYGRGGSSHGAPRLSFAERLARRTPKTRDEKRAAADLRDEAENYVSMEFKDEVDSLADRWLCRARSDVLRLANPAAAIEKLEVEVAPKVKKPLLQLATVTKVSPRELNVVANTSQFVTPVLQRLQRHDRSLTPIKDGFKIKLTLVPITRQRRDETADAVSTYKADFHKGMKNLRRHAINYIDGLKISDDGLVRELTATLEEQCREYEAEHVAEFDELREEALIQQDDEEEEV